MQNYKLKKLQKILKPYIKLDKKMQIEIEKYKFHQLKRRISIHNTDVKK